MKYLFFLFIIFPYFHSIACHALKFNSENRELDSQDLCKPKNKSTYDISFGKKLNFHEENSRFTLIMINTEISVNWVNVILQLDARESLISGTIRDSQISGNFTLANLKNSLWTNVTLKNVRFNYADLRGADFSHTVWGEQIEAKGAIFNNTTKFPFSTSEALQMGMVLR